MFALLGAVAATGTATAQSDRPTVVVVGNETTVNETTTVRVVLTSAPNGLSGYYLDLHVETAGVARIESASYPEQFGLTSAPRITDGTTVTLEAADMEGAIGSGATNVTLATVTLVGVSRGNATLTVDPRQFDDDGGAFTPATQSGTVVVTDGASETRSDGGGTDGTTAGTDRSGTAGGGETTGASAPLSPILTLVAVGLAVAVGLRRRK
ncbi:hypothetical protein [Salarchaeum sp. JOR-1]|uniref:hypothetical protein n=1 Tax=Salarchaeum sp. JOR-1 TaxID=2599399 RepID=UPI001198A0E8|nr:hypothetical protein [Salarchaeum sp. JOR-1]QDX39388.1 hypothetical protein FQU85_00265 [Salarchaeum sp. JOR-1]